MTNQDIKSDVPKSLSAIDRQNADVTIYTDGSCSGGIKDGGAAAVITMGPASSPVELEVSQAKGSSLTTSYKEEDRALNLGLEWVASHQECATVTFCTDSLSLLQAIDNLNPTTTQIRQRME